MPQFATASAAALLSGLGAVVSDPKICELELGTAAPLAAAPPRLAGDLPTRGGGGRPFFAR